MLEFNGRTYIDIKFEGVDFTVSSKAFKKLTIRQALDLRIPIAELSLSGISYDVIEKFDVPNIKMTVSYATSKANAKDAPYTFLHTNMSIKPSESEVLDISLFFILDLYDFMNKPCIFAKKGISSDIIKELPSIEVNTDNLYTGEDEQIWIQHNIPDKEFLARILRVAKTESFPLSAITLDKKLSVFDVKKQFEKEPTLSFHTGPYNKGYKISSFSLSTNRGVMQAYFGDGRAFPVIDFYKAEKHENFAVSKEEVVSIGRSNYNPNEVSYGKPFQMKYNAGNVHEAYFDTMQKNLKSKVLLYARPLTMVLSNTSIPEKDLKLGDILDVHIYHPGTQNEIGYLTGKYLLGEKNVDISTTGINTQLVAVR